MHERIGRAHHRLIDQLIARGALWSRPLIAAFRATPRHLFLPRIYDASKQGWRAIDTREPGPTELRLLYADRALTTRLSGGPGLPAPISSSSQPSLMAQMLEDLDLRRGLRVLEVGAGTGYNAALLAHVVGPITSIDVDREVLAEARAHLLAFPDRTVDFRHSDGREGSPEGAPFDRILVTASTPALEPAWVGQLAEGGRLLAPVDLAPSLAYLLSGTARRGVFEGRLTRPAYFMPLRAEGRTGREARGPWLPDPQGLQALAAPWADWCERRPGSSGANFLQALAFLGWLDGRTVSCVNVSGQGNTYGVGDLAEGHVCWMGPREWRISGPLGREMGERLWQTFLEAGGPRPPEFRLRAYPPDIDPGDGGSPCRLRFRRKGVRHQEVWELPEVRERPEWA
jgi:protein-L-isoaspartate(D-aspartate) O-methyltransferase